jgi:hypothetical protein
VAKQVQTWGQWLDGHMCTGALGFAATARRNVEHGHRQVKQGLGPPGCVRSCACRTPTARPWWQHETDGVHQAREQRRENSEERWLDNMRYDEDGETLRFGLGKERRVLWSEFRFGNDELG